MGRFPGILVLLAVCWPVTNSVAQRKGGPEDALVRTGLAVEQTRPTRQSFVGSLQPLQRSVVGSAVEERVEQVLVEAGDFVELPVESDEPAPVLVELRRDTIKIEMQAADIELELRQQALEELLQTIPKEIALAEANVQRAEAELEYAKKTYERLQGLAESAMSTQEVEESVSNFRARSEDLNAVSIELQKLQATQDIRLTIARRSVARQQAEVERMQDLQSRYSIRAPFTGFITRKLVERGNWVTQGTPVVEIVQLDPIELQISVPQEYATRLQHSFAQAADDSPLPATVKVDFLSEPLTGHVDRIVPDADPRTRSLPVIIRIANPDFTLKPGWLARAELNIGRAQTVTMVPKDALVLSQDRIRVFKLQRSGDRVTVHSIDVDTGPASGDLIEVDGDVQPGDEIVVQGNERLRDNQQVKILQN
ncbi:MAG: efflux RND transporter periplasmic adaptor subunit [Pirellulaceae bacterium]